MTPLIKPFATINEQIDVLAARGLALNRSEAEQWLRNVSYYRLSGYWYPYRKLVPGSSERLDAFTDGANFDEIARLYEFDRKLRTLIHDGIERVEVSLRSHVSYVLGARGPLDYQKDSLFRPSFDHSKWIETARTRAERARRHSKAIRHHESRYEGALPIWVLTEVLDFADVSLLYEALQARDQWTIADQLGLRVDDSKLRSSQRVKVRKHHPLARRLEQLTVLRNTCAHHSRVWNRSFTPVSTTALKTIDKLQSLPTGQSERLYGALLLLSFLLENISPGTSWSQKIVSLVETSFVTIPGRTVSEMGFPETWLEGLSAMSK